MTFGVMRASSNILTLPPGNGGNFVSEIGISRATSALACFDGDSRLQPRDAPSS